MSDPEQYVVYAIDDDGRPLPRFLSVCDDSDEAYDEMCRWWVAFRYGQKAKPMGYGGVSYDRVANFDEWKAPEDTDE